MLAAQKNCPTKTNASVWWKTGYLPSLMVSFNFWQCTCNFGRGDGVGRPIAAAAAGALVSDALARGMRRAIAFMFISAPVV